jgi:hypothetical protein
MHHTVFLRSRLWFIGTFIAANLLAALAFAQTSTNENTAAQSETATRAKKKSERAKKSDQERKLKLALLGSEVTYSAPRRWAKPQTSSRGKLEALQFVIPLPSSDHTPRTTSAIVVAELNADNLSLTDFSNSKLPRKYPAGTVVADQADGDSWRTVVSHVHEGNPPYTVVDRFGVAAGLRVHFRIIFPKEDDAKAAWLKTLAQESNDFIRSLHINNKNKVTADLFYDTGRWGLREAKAAKKIVAKEPAKDTQKVKAPSVKKATVQNSPKVGEEFSP